MIEMIREYPPTYVDPTSSDSSEDQREGPSPTMTASLESEWSRLPPIQEHNICIPIPAKTTPPQSETPSVESKPKGACCNLEITIKALLILLEIYMGALLLLLPRRRGWIVHPILIGCAVLWGTISVVNEWYIGMLFCGLALVAHGILLISFSGMIPLEGHLFFAVLIVFGYVIFLL